jgi:hypothetical protein
MFYLVVVGQLMTIAVALVAIRKAYADREYSQFTLVIHRDTHDRLNLAFLNGGTQPISVLQLSYFEQPLPSVAGASSSLRPVYLHAAPSDGRLEVAPLLVKAKDAEPVSVRSDFNGIRPNLAPPAADGMRFLLSLRIVAASGSGVKVERDIPLVKLSGEGSARWEPATKDLADAGGSYAVTLIDQSTSRVTG